MNTRNHRKPPAAAARTLAAWLLAAAPWALTAPAQAAEETRTTAYVYDSQGQLLREVVEHADSRLCVASVYTYDPHGNRNSVQQRNCNGSALPGVGSEAAAPAATGLAAFSLGTVTQQYDYPGVAGASARQITTTNALYVQGAEVVDPRFGTPLSVTDANGRVTRYRYDALGRKTLEQRPDGNGTRWLYQQCSTTVVCAAVRNDQTGTDVVPAYVVTSYPVSGANVNTDAGTKDGPHTKAYFDNLEREIRVERQGWDGDGVTRLVYEDTTYNNRGKLYRKSAPYYAGSPAAWATFYFDVSGRLTYQSEPHTGATASAYVSFTYEGLKTTRTVQAVATATPHSTQTAQTTIERRNAAGHLVAITDTEGRTQTRTYTPWGDLQSAVDPLGNTVRMEYDRLGRKTKLIDPDLGTWTYEHDALSRLVKQTDAEGQTRTTVNWFTTLSYDTLGRLSRRLEPDHDSRWFYDTRYADGSACANARGSLCEAATYTGTDTLVFGRRHAYDSLGRLSRTTSRATVPVAGTTGEYIADLTYNGRGQVVTQTYPGPAATGARLSLTLGYTSLGYLQTVRNTATSLAYWTGNQYDAQGNPTGQAYGNGVATTRSYDVKSRLLTSAAGSGNAVQNDSYGYDLQGKLRSRSETRAGAILTHQYDYDNLNRLKTETRSGGALTAAQAITWSYDAIGNITSRSDVGTYTYPAAGSARPHAVSSVTGTVNGVANPSYSYDANGNIVSSAGRTATWMSFNLPATLARGTNQLAWAYDSEHERVREDLSVNGTVTRTTIYVNPAAGAGLYYEEELSGGVLERRHYINGGHGPVGVLTRTGSTDEMRYWHKDHLGSTQVVTDETGAVVERMEYEPFGKRRGADNATDAAGTLAGQTTDRGFTGHEMLDEVGLVHMNGRIYDPAIGRFLSADPGVPDPNNLQSYNRYSYTRNDPLSMTDPSGFNETYCDCSTAGYGSYSFYDAPAVYTGAGSGSGSLGTSNNGVLWSLALDPLGHGQSSTSSWYTPYTPAVLPLPERAGEKSDWREKATGFIPVYGPIRDFKADMEEGRFGWAGFNGTMAVVDGLSLGSGAVITVPAKALAKKLFSEGAEHAATQLARDSAELVAKNAAKGLGGFKVGITADEIAALNRTFGNGFAYRKVDTVMANASWYDGFYNKSASVILDIAGGHLFENGNKRTAVAAIEVLISRNAVSGPPQTVVWNVVDRVATGELKDVRAIAKALQGF
jgi:RHS repeat-associated protein